ncbi:MAG TPA: ABC transporter permease, partial [Thermoplasmata archaeon]|nr:ABC transporter permease [Thermoplasmata archaeon]
GIPVFGMYTIGAAYPSVLDQGVDLLSHLLLPLATLTIVLYGEFTIIMRNALIDILSEDYIVFARSKGASDRRIMQRHAYPNAQLPMISIIAVNVGLVVGGAILTEVVFSWPGVGLLIYSSITARDYPILQAAFLVVAISVVVANLVADLLYGVFDPRIRYG